MRQIQDEMFQILIKETTQSSWKIPLFSKSINYKVTLSKLYLDFGLQSAASATLPLYDQFTIINEGWRQK